MFIIGLTGGIGSGKSSVAHWLAERGVPVIDADRIVHQLYEQPDVIDQVVREFGPGIQGADSRIDRKALGSLVFRDREARRRLEGILHPAVHQAMQIETDRQAESGQSICVWDVPLLYEAAMQSYADQVWVVWVSRDIQVLRVQRRDKLGAEDVLARIRAQMSLDKKARRADVVIDNSGTWQHTEEQLNRIWATLQFK